MRAIKNGWTIEGTPEEINALIEMSAYTDTLTAQASDPDPKETPKKTEKQKTQPVPRRNLDWKKAEALKEAGWNFKKIAEEIGTTYQTVYGHFRAD